MQHLDRNKCLIVFTAFLLLIPLRLASAKSYSQIGRIPMTPEAFVQHCNQLDLPFLKLPRIAYQGKEQDDISGERVSSYNSNLLMLSHIDIQTDKSKQISKLCILGKNTKQGEYITKQYLKRILYGLGFSGDNAEEQIDSLIKTCDEIASDNRGVFLPNLQNCTGSLFLAKITTVNSTAYCFWGNRDQ